MADTASVSPGPSPAQCDVLSFFGKAIPQTRRQASIVIGVIFEDVVNQQRWRVERARRYLSGFEAPRRAPDDPQDSHMVVFNATRALLHGFGLSQAEAYPLLLDYLTRSDLPWLDHEVQHKLRSVDAQPSKHPRGYLCEFGAPLPNAAAKKEAGKLPDREVRKKVEFDPAKLAELAAPWREVASMEFLANRSSVDPATVGPIDFLAALYRPKEKVLCFTDYFSQGQYLWPEEVPVQSAPLGVWYLPQPVSGETKPNPEGKPRPDGGAPLSRRTQHCVTSFRYMLLESDKADMRDWVGFIVQTPLCIDALYTSGGRSIHALVRVDCKTKGEWDEEKREMLPFLMGCVMVGGDRGVLSAVRLSRLPGCYREGKEDDQSRYVRYPRPKLQKLLYLRPGSDARPICELPARRDVAETWLARGRAAVDGLEADVESVKAGLRYYSTNGACAQALRDLVAGESE